jgi:Arc/MetJ-type ribon-helix-helix transcriptional regulator
MNLALKREMIRFIDRKVRSGQYARPEDVVQAGLATLIAIDEFGEFEKGETGCAASRGRAEYQEVWNLGRGRGSRAAETAARKWPETRRMTFRVSRRASADLDAIWHFIAQDSVSARTR